MTAVGGNTCPVRLRLGERKTLIIEAPVFAHPAGAAAQAATAAPARIAAQRPAAAGAIAPGTLVALVEAVPTRSDELAGAVVEAAEARGLRCGILSLEPQNRLAGRFGCPATTPAWKWKEESPDLLVAQGPRTVVAGPEFEEELDGPAVDRVLSRLRDATDVAVVDLGCRWLPRLFRPVLTAATHIWVLTRPGQWSGAEMRLQQAELSGWTDMSRVRLVVVGAGAPVSVQFHAMVAGVLPDVAGQPALDFVFRELGRGSR